MLCKRNRKYTMELILLMVVKVEEKFQKTRHVKNNNQSKKCILRGQRNTRYYDRVLFNKKNLII